jgi:hypothetical protein
MFPKWKYHPTKPAVIVYTPEEERALGDGWVDSPADFVKAAAEGVVQEVEHVAKHVHEAVVKELEGLKQDYAEFFDKVKGCTAIKDVKALIDEYETE